MSVGAVVTPEGYVITSSAPFQARKPNSSQPVRTQVSGTFAQSLDSSWSDFDIISIDSSRGVALIKPRREKHALSYLPVGENGGATEIQPVVALSLETDADGRVVKAFGLQGSLESITSDRELTAVIRLVVGSEKVLIGSPIVNPNGQLLGIVSEIGKGDTLRAIPVSSFGTALDLARIGATGEKIPIPCGRVDSISIQGVLQKHVGGESIEKFEQVYSAPPGFRIVGTSMLIALANGVVAPHLLK